MTSKTPKKLPKKDIKRTGEPMDIPRSKNHASPGTGKTMTASVVKSPDAAPTPHRKNKSP